MKRGVVETALRQTPDERHLSAFESKTNASARARLLTFMPFAAGFSVTGAFAATESLDPMTRTWTRPEIMQPHHVVAPAAFPAPPLIPRTLNISSLPRNDFKAAIVALTTLA